MTDQVVDELNTWQQRPLDRVYPVVLIDALHVKIREGDCPDLGSGALSVVTVGDLS